MTGIALGSGLIVVVVLVLVLVLVHHHGDSTHPFTTTDSDQHHRCMFCNHRRGEHGNLSGEWTLRFPCLHPGCTCPAFTTPHDDIRKG